MTAHMPAARAGFALPSYEHSAGTHLPLGYPGYRSTALRAPRRPPVVLPQLLTEVTGPLLGAERVTAADADLTSQHAGTPIGERIIVSGRVLDSDGRPPTGPDGSYRIVTLKPGALPSPGGSTEAPHIDVSVFARGLLNRVVTRIYFPDEADANAADPQVPGRLRFDINLQGDTETVFFDV